MLDYLKDSNLSLKILNYFQDDNNLYLIFKNENGLSLSKFLQTYDLKVTISRFS